MRYQIYPATETFATDAMESMVSLVQSRGFKVVVQRRGSVVVEGDPKAMQQLSPLVPGWDIDPVQKSASDSAYQGTLKHKRSLGNE